VSQTEPAPTPQPVLPPTSLPSLPVVAASWTLSTASPVVRDEGARWEALAEEIRMQVLQQMDLFTDTGLREQLSAHLQPIVDRASADMVAEINQQIGTLLRAQVAETIEREIERWRRQSR